MISVVEAVLLLHFGLVSAESTGETSTLRFVHAVWRHGDRAPLSGTFPTDTENGLSTWKEGWGGLTSLGLSQHYDLGAYLRSRYIDTGFLSPQYRSEEIVVRSTNYERTKNSARSNMLGFYALAEKANLEEAIKQVPIPIDTAQTTVIDIEGIGGKCPVANKARSDALGRSDEVRRVESENREFMDFLQNRSGLSRSSVVRGITHIYEPLICEKLHNRKWPTWVTPEIFQLVVDLYDWTWSVWYIDPTVLRLKAGPLIREIALRSEGSAGKTLQPQDLKYYVYSGHDHTLVALLTVLGAFDDRAPPFASAVLLELHEQPEDHFFMKAFYISETGTDITPRPVNMQRCGGFECDLTAFVTLAKNNSYEPEARDSECGIVRKATI